MSRHLSQIIVESEEDAEGEEEGEGRDEMPNVVMIVEIQQNAVAVLFPRLSSWHIP